MHHTKLAALTLLTLTSALAAPVKDNTIQGKITDWPAGKTGEVRLVVREGQFGWDSAPALAKTAVNEKGEFSLPLPDAVALQKVLPAASDTVTLRAACVDSSLGCEKPLKADPAISWNVFELQAFADGKRLDTVKFSNSLLDSYRAGAVRTLLVYSSAASKVTGEYFTAGQVSAQNTWEASLNAGWNWLTAETKAKDPGTGMWPVKIGNTAPPQDAKLYLTTRRGGIGLQVNLGQSSGTAVSAVTSGGAAEKAGLQVGDSIINVDGFDTTSLMPNSVGPLISGEPGQPVTIVVLRGQNKEKLTFTVTRTLLPLP